MSGAREAVVQAQIMAYLSARGFVNASNPGALAGALLSGGGFFWRNNSGAHRVGNRFIRYGCPGSADILGVLPPTGRLLAVEVKRAKGGRLSEDQRRWGESVTRAGGLYVVASSIDDLKAALETA